MTREGARSPWPVRDFAREYPAGEVCRRAVLEHITPLPAQSVLLNTDCALRENVTFDQGCGQHVVPHGLSTLSAEPPAVRGCCARRRCRAGRPQRPTRRRRRAVHARTTEGWPGTLDDQRPVRRVRRGPGRPARGRQPRRRSGEALGGGRHGDGDRRHPPRQGGGGRRPGGGGDRAGTAGVVHRRGERLPQPAATRRHRSRLRGDAMGMASPHGEGGDGPRQARSGRASDRAAPRRDLGPRPHL